MTLRELREKKFMTATELAERVGVSRQAIYTWEKGRGKPSLRNMKTLIDLFGEQVWDCFG